MVQSNGLHLQALTGEQQEEDWARLSYSIVGNHNENGEFFMGLRIFYANYPIGGKLTLN